MAREYARVHDYYLQNLNDLQPLSPLPSFHYDLAEANQSPATAYELTAGMAGGCAHAAGANAAARAPPPHSHSHTHDLDHDHDTPNRKSPQNVESDMYKIGTCEGSHTSSYLPPAPSSLLMVPITRKRKSSSQKLRHANFIEFPYPLPGDITKDIPIKSGTASTFDDDCTDDTRTSRNLPDKKQNHSEIEKRRRDKMNTYITELGSLIPMCGAMARKLDKLTVLRMAVQHLKTVQGTLTASPLSLRLRPAFLSQRDLNALILQAAQNCFVIVVGCDRGRVLYVSDSVKNMLLYEQSELVGQSLFDVLHPKDVAKVKEQLSSSDLSPRERLIDIKTMMPVKADVVSGASRLCPGARRSFFCRIKCRPTPAATPSEHAPAPADKDPEDPAKARKKSEKKYCVIHCTGYLKSWADVDIQEGNASTEGVEEGDSCNMSCLVAVGRTLPDLPPAPCECSTASSPPTRYLQYVSRHATDGKFLFVDQRVTLALGFLPQELLGTSLYEHVWGPELGAVARTHKQALLRRDALHTPTYSFRRKDGSLARIQTHFKPFKNPWTKEVECLVANNTVISDTQVPHPQDPSQEGFDVFEQKADLEMQRLIDSQVESHKIGSAIAKEALRISSPVFPPEIPIDLQDAIYNQQVLNNVPLSAAGGSFSPIEEPVEAMSSAPATPIAETPVIPPLGLDGNDEAAMAVIMSLLEADAGLGGSINFSGLPWPLP